jgi:hypothetical protein
MNDWWWELDDAILGRLAEKGSMTPAEIGRELGISEDGVTSLLARLAQEGKVSIARVNAHLMAPTVKPAMKRSTKKL